METILPISPDEWNLVLALHSHKFPGCDVESLRRKFHSCHRKIIPTGNPNMPEKIRITKRVKYLIGDRASIGGGAEEYDIFWNTFSSNADDSDPTVTIANPPLSDVTCTDQAVLPTQATATNTATPTATGGVILGESNSNSSDTLAQQAVVNRLVPRGAGDTGNKKTDLLQIMLLQMQNEAAEREAERRERAEDRKQLNAMMATIARVYFEGNSRKTIKIRRKNSENNINISSSSETSDIEDDN